MTPLRIALIASARFPLREPFMGGLEAHTHALAAALQRRGHELVVMAGAGEGSDLPVTTVQAAGFTSSPAARDDVGASPEEWMREHHSYLDFLVGLSRGDHGHVDVVHNNSLHHLPVAMAGMLPAPLVTTLHTPPLAWLESAAAVAGSASRFVAVSAHTARAWSHVVDATVIGNGVDTGFWSPPPQEAAGSAPYLVWSGRLVPEKAPHEAIAAARRAGMPLVLAGPVHDRDYYRTAVEPALGEDVRYLGHLDSAELRDVVAGAAVALVTPRWAEPFGLVAAEALACGTPVVGYDAGALSEVVAAGSGRLVPTGDVDALGDAVREVLGLDREVVRESAVRRLGHARMVDDYERLYRSLLPCSDAA